jgi:hypothetical protein
MIAVTALVATSVFGASLSHLLKTQRLYGQNWQLDLGNMTTPQLHKALAVMVPDPQVTKVTWGFSGKYLRVGKAPVEAIFMTVAKGPMSFSLVGGHHPRGDHQIALGTATLRQAGLHIGSRVPVTITNRSNAWISRSFEVVGTVALPRPSALAGWALGRCSRSMPPGRWCVRAGPLKARASAS